MKQFTRISGLLILAVLLFSCQTAPEAPPEEEEAPPEVPEEEEAAPLPESERARARELRDLIAQYELDRFAEDAYTAGQDAFEQAEEAYGDDNEAAASSYEQAIARFEEVVDTGAAELQSEWEGRIEELNAEAQQLKAPRAMSDAYEQARSTLEEARTALENQEYSTAASLYVESYEQHDSVVNQTREKRRRALEALEQADSELQTTEGDIERLEEEQRTFDPEAEDGGEDQS
jgi:exonuclease VII small subunit